MNFDSAYSCILCMIVLYHLFPVGSSYGLLNINESNSFARQGQPNCAKLTVKHHVVYPCIISDFQQNLNACSASDPRNFVVIFFAPDYSTCSFSKSVKTSS